MAMKEYSTFPKAYETGASPSDWLVSYPGHSLRVGVLTLCRDAVSVFYSPYWLGLVIKSRTTYQALNFLSPTRCIKGIISKYLQCILINSNKLFTQSAGAVEYTDCTFNRGLRPPPTNECSGYDTKQSDGEVPVMLGIGGIQSTPSLPLLPGPLWSRVVAPDRALSMG